MTTDATTTNLQINVMNKSQFEDITPADNQLYFVENDESHTFVKSVSDTAPENPSSGDKYVNTTTKKIYTFTDGSWGSGEDLSEDSIYVKSDDGTMFVYDGTNVSQIGGNGNALNVDNITNILDENNKIRVIGVIDKNSGNPKYDWIGTKQQYNNLQTYNDNWIYYITDSDSTSGNYSLNNVYNRLNAAYAWTRNGTVVYTVPSPVEGFKTYSNPETLVVSSTITGYDGETSITDANGTYTRDTTNDTVFGLVPPESKSQFLTVYDLLKAIKG